MKDFRELTVWQKAHLVTLEVYRHTNSFPLEERYGLTSQLRRAVLSIPMNIAEGCGQRTDKDFAYFLQIAFGSANETEYALLLSKELGYLEEVYYSELQIALEEVKRMLASLIAKVKDNQQAES